MSALGNTLPLVEMADPSDERVVAAEVEVVDAPDVKRYALAPLASIEAGFAALVEQHGGKTYADIQTVKGRDAAVQDRLAIRNVRYEIPKVVKAQKAAVKEWAAEANKAIDKLGEDMENRLLAIETPITAAIDAEDLRKKKAKEEADRIKAAKASAAATTIEAIRNRITLAVGQNPAAILEIISVCEAIEATEEEYGERTGEVLRARSETLAKLREMHATQVQWEETQAAAREKLRKDGLQAKIDAFGRMAFDAIGKPSAVVQRAIADLEAVDITAETFAERANDALDAQQAVLKSLDTLLTSARASEAAAAVQAENERKAAEARAESERLDRQRKDQELRDEQQKQAAADLLRQQQEQATQAENLANARAEQIAAAVLAIENLPSNYSAAMSAESLTEVIEGLRARKLGIVEFGSKIGTARTALAAAVEKIEAMRAAAISRECAEAEMDAAALPPAAPPAAAAEPDALPAEEATFHGLFGSAAAVPTQAPAPVAAAAAAAAVKTITPAGILATLQQTAAALGGLMSIVRESSGVIGYHNDGSVADWDEFEEVTRASLALTAAHDALDAENCPF